MRRILAGIVIAVMLTGGAAAGPFEDAANSNSKEYWLEQYSSSRNEWDRVARVFGFHDDREGCEMIVKALSVTLPKARYRCVAAN